MINLNKEQLLAKNEAQLVTSQELFSLKIEKRESKRVAQEILDEIRKKIIISIDEVTKDDDKITHVPIFGMIDFINKCIFLRINSLKNKK